MYCSHGGRSGLRYIHRSDGGRSDLRYIPQSFSRRQIWSEVHIWFSGGRSGLYIINYIVLVAAGLRYMHCSHGGRSGLRYMCCSQGGRLDCSTCVVLMAAGPD